MKDEKSLIRKAKYPRIWKPYLRLYKVSREAKGTPGEIMARLTLRTTADGEVKAVDDRAGISMICEKAVKF